MHILLAGFVFLDSLENFRCDGCGDPAAGLCALHEHDNNIFGIVVGSEGNEPGVVVFFSRAPELGGACFAGGDHFGVRCPPRRAAAFIDDLPHAFADMIDLILGDAAIGDNVCADAWRLLGYGLASLVDNAVDEAGVVNRAAIRNGGGHHGHLEG